MREISFEEYDKKRKSAKIDLLEIRNDLDKKVSSGLKTRDSEKRFLLYKLAKEKKKVCYSLLLVRGFFYARKCHIVKGIYESKKN